ncbi:hypothetical protein [Sphingomonas sp.]|jgi:orotate phosphoribosyltransferase|uniref:hypothetical protein n=1 Tax=Sphingomonas sp. TaxID=28214 RepID=UPI002DF41B84|nr:hypothetical protein [Sphingomonas sp.]
MPAVDQFLGGWFNTGVLAMLGVATLLFVAEATNILHPKVAEWLNRNRLAQTMKLLREFGIDTETPRRVNEVARLEQISGPDLAARVSGRLQHAKVGHKVTVGREVVVPIDDYIDLMGATAEPQVASLYARDLAARWRQLADVGGQVQNLPIDFIVTPKTGSPLLGSAFAALLRKPLLLHNPESKFRSTPDDPKAVFDCGELPAPGARGLIVDDSSTGGGKAVRLIEDLRRSGWLVSDFLVVFEPQAKAGTGQNASTRLRPLGVALHSIVKT